MSLCRLLHRSIRRYSTTTPFQFPITPQNDTSTPQFIPQRSSGFSSAEEAAAERRRNKRRLRIEPPLYALRSNNNYNNNNKNNQSENKPRLPDSTSSLVGNRLNLHNRVQSLIRAHDLDSASFIARQSVYGPVRPTVFTCNAIIAAMYRGKRYEDAKALFHYFFKQFDVIPNIVSYNNLIVSHCELGEVDDAVKVYEYVIENETYSPSPVSYRHLTKGLVDAGRIKEAVSLLREMLNKGHGADSLVFNNVIKGFLELGELDKANEVFDELKERCTVYDGVVNATFMDWFFKEGKGREAMESYRDLMGRGYRMVPATRNVLLETLLRHGKNKEAWELFHDMLDDHTPPTFQAVNSDTVNMMVNECFKEGKIEEAKDVFKRSGKGVKSKPFQMDVPGFNNMITRFCELEMMEEAEEYYVQLVSKSLSTDVNTYKTLIDAYIKVDKVDEMIVKYSKMVELGSRVIPMYANKWFGYMIEKGKASECVPILTKMAEREPKPDVTTYDVVIRGLVQESNYDGITDLVGEIANHGIGFTASLKEFVLDAFEKLGRRKEIEDIMNRPVNVSPRPPYQGVNSTKPWQRTSQAPNSANQFPQTHQSQMNSSSPQVAGQVSNQHSWQGPSQTLNISNRFSQSQMSWPPPHMSGQVSNQQEQWQRPSQTPNNFNQFPQTHQSQMNSPSPHMAGQVSNQQGVWQGTSQPTSYGNHFQEQTHQSQMNSSLPMAEQVKNQQNPWQGTSQPTSYGSQYQEHTQQSQMKPPSHMSEQGTSKPTSYGSQYQEHTQQSQMNPPSHMSEPVRNQRMTWQANYIPPASYSNQSQMNPPSHMSEPGRNQRMTWQANYIPPASYSNQFGEQRTSYQNNFAEQHIPRPPITQHNHQMSEQDDEILRVAGQNAR